MGLLLVAAVILSLQTGLLVGGSLKSKIKIVEK